MVAFKDLLILNIDYPSSLGSSFVIETQTHGRRIGLARTNLLKQDEKLAGLLVSLYICHTKAMTALVEFGTRCLY